jgi:hypothetical protein
MPVKNSPQEPGAVAASLYLPADSEAIHAQLERLLTSPHLRNSKRCQGLLRFVVESCLEGSLDKVKERCIGFEVFQRDANYDTSQDSIVRTTAAEVRKRLAQYYLESGHENEIRFSLPNGSYCPEFRFPVIAVSAPQPVALPLEEPAAPQKRISTARRLWPWAAAAVAFASLTAAYLATRPTPIDLFWKPLIDDAAGVVICVEQPLKISRFTGPRAGDLNQKLFVDPAAKDALEHTSVKLSDLEPTGAQYFTYGDLISASRLSEILGRKGKSFQVLGDRNTEYRDLRGRPAILIGEFNNQWTRGLTGELRYYLDKDTAAGQYQIRDRQHPGTPVASVPKDVRLEQYAIVSRVIDVSTEKTVIAMSGSTYFGTMAGSDFLTRASYMEEAFRNAPKDWNRKNIQVVLKAAMVAGAPGPPHVIATYFW